MKKEKSCGAVVYRWGTKGLEILVEYMAKGHVSIPKGHVEPGETEAQTALREIWEETALRVSLDTGFRRVVSYSPAPDVEKDVVFFVAELLGDAAITAQEYEVSRAVFLPAAEAMAAMSYASDRETIAAAVAYISEKG